VHDQPFILPEYDDRAWLQFRWIAASNRNQIAGPESGNHTGPGDFQLNLPLIARDVRNEVAARRLQVRLGDHACLRYEVIRFWWHPLCVVCTLPHVSAMVSNTRS
jgi:hypothetical protein